MITLIAKVLFWASFATVVACIEIESEGRFGWADKTPTWFRTTGFFGKLYGKMMGGKPLTGYHAFMFFLPVLIFHAHFFMGMEWSGREELLAWAMYFAWCPMWDYFWFVLNPHYRDKFTPSHIWWHAKSPWVFGLFPLDYLVGVTISLGFAGGAAWLSGSLEIFVRHAELLSGFCAYTALLHLFAPLYHRWYVRMRKHDDRDKVDIFYK